MAKVKATDRIEGTQLEGIPVNSLGFQPGIVLYHRDWRDLYFLRERKNWKEEDYFEYAELRFKDLKIEHP